MRMNGLEQSSTAKRLSKPDCDVGLNHFDKIARDMWSVIYGLAMPQLKNRRHELFAVELATGAPLLSAFLAAGYRDSYSARYNASRLRNTPAVRTRVDELLTEFGERSLVQKDWVLSQLIPIVEGNIKELFEVRAGASGQMTLKLRPLSELSSRTTAAISRIKVDEEGRPVEVWLHNKTETANVLLRGIGAIKEDRVVIAALEKKASELSDDELKALEGRIAIIP